MPAEEGDFARHALRFQPMDLPQHWPLPEAADLLGDILAAYAEPTRRYHDSRHLAEVLERIEELREEGERFDPLTVTLAAFFHDAVYDGERDAEERSATWAEEALRDHLDADVVAEIARLVRLTETHDPEPHDLGGRVLSDADLAILASPKERYGEYAATVREEYGYLSDEEFRVGRAQVLEGLLEKESLFSTPYARISWEAAARANIAAEMETLAP
ncbi:putative metal-dependent HD superfamily phosphohydrolase [Nocardioides albertanoniae]|uniref:Putative metal-dependent HD superfamily phosphohydrolase n=2 Tax=Nocardioides albertanoniae TaxID=1175486 RepID=A0A543A3B8_9ACTN|nr:putative metal-dependent HD superfamily phosphohydrolase [Nocardioides albertanoniae]